MKDRHIKSVEVGYPEYQRAVHNIVHNCMRLTKEDRFVVITDQDREDIGQAIFEGAKRLLPTQLIKIENYMERPATSFPDKLKEDLVQFAPTASVYAATGQEGEVDVFRVPLIGFLTQDLRVRHGHMISIDSHIMKDAMSKDYAKIYETTHKLHSLLKDARSMHVTDPHGTDLTVTFSPDLRWNASDGVPKGPGDWTNLPDGEVFTCPEDANGEVVVWEVGDYFSDKYGLLDKPLILTIENSRVVNILSQNADLKEELWNYLHQEENANRMGEFAVGCLLGLDKLIGNLLQDEKYPGIHMAFGHPYPEFTGQTAWDAGPHVDVIPLNVDAKVDGNPLLRNGKFVEGIF